MIKNQGLYDRFLRYVKIDTGSEEETGRHPSTEKQFALAEVLAKELENLGAKVDFDREHCYVYAQVPGVQGQPALGFISHMDTSPAVTGQNVRPRLLVNYQGEDPLKLLDSQKFPELLNHIGEDLIATDGTTLLGADDKAGIAEIMNLAEYLLRNPHAPAHRPIRIAFTPDEEIGEGTAFFDPDRFGAREAYTVDGGKLGEIEYECFNAAAAKVCVKGISVHTGDAKDAMINANRLALEFQSMLPEAEVPEHTEGREGFYHLDAMTGSVESAELKYIIRDHDQEKFEERKAVMRRIADYLNDKYRSAYGGEVISLEISDQYRNMLEIIKDHMDLPNRAVRALKDLGVKPSVQPIRGGTDGAVLSFRGIPCPNLCTGGYNYHSRFEYASVQEMEKTAELLIKLSVSDEK